MGLILLDSWTLIHSVLCPFAPLTVPAEQCNNHKEAALNYANYQDVENVKISHFSFRKTIPRTLNLDSV